MAKKATLTTCNGGHLGSDDPQKETQDVKPLLSTGVNATEEEVIQDNQDEEDDNVLPVPGTIERGS